MKATIYPNAAIVGCLGAANAVFLAARNQSLVMGLVFLAVAIAVAALLNVVFARRDKQNS
ncbi:hypothetical protein [Corynebacterium ulceribovis]|uniref:hypothetical protein n=1 Tax=Corynebacterium ulceribovis TaxID=487732 RepID=UPI000365B97B|nr:hypothetical protein [Corynebacterium ulceribovis]